MGDRRIHALAWQCCGKAFNCLSKHRLGASKVFLVKVNGAKVGICHSHELVVFAIDISPDNGRFLEACKGLVILVAAVSERPQFVEHRCYRRMISSVYALLGGQRLLKQDLGLVKFFLVNQGLGECVLICSCFGMVGSIPGFRNGQGFSVVGLCLPILSVMDRDCAKVVELLGD